MVTKTTTSVFIFSLILLFSNIIHGQNIKWTQYSDVPKNMLAHKIISVDESGIYVYQASRKIKRLAKYTFGLQLITEKEIPIDSKISNIEHIEITSSEAVVYFSMYNSIDARHGLFYLKIPHNGQAVLPPKNLINQENVPSKGKSLFQIVSPKDQSYQVVTHFYENLKSESVLSVAYYNPQLEKITEKTVSIPSNTIDMALKQYLLDNDGNLYALFVCGDKFKNSGDNTRQFIRIIRISKSDIKYRITDLNDENLMLTSAFMGLEKATNKIVIAGFYSTGSSSLIQGTFISYYSQDSEQMAPLNHQPFTGSFLARIKTLVGEKSGRKNSEFEVKQIIVRSDGGAVLAAESFYTSVQSYIQYSQGFPMTRYITYYHFDEILTLSIDPDGTIDWHQVIPKKQVSTSLSDVHSFAMARTPEKLWFVFHDTNIGKGAMVQYNISNKGDLSSIFTSPPDLTGTYMFPIDAKQVSSKSLLIPAMRGRKFGLIKITY